MGFPGVHEMSEEERRQFAARLKGFRKRHRLSQQDVARALGLGRDTIGSLELCRSRPFPQTILKIAELERKYERAREAELDGLDGLA